MSCLQFAGKIIIIKPYLQMSRALRRSPCTDATLRAQNCTAIGSTTAMLPVTSDPSDPSLSVRIAAICSREYGGKWRRHGRQETWDWSRGRSRSVRSRALAIPDKVESSEMNYSRPSPRGGKGGGATIPGLTNEQQSGVWEGRPLKERVEHFLSPGAQLVHLVQHHHSGEGSSSSDMARQ